MCAGSVPGEIPVSDGLNMLTAAAEAEGENSDES